MARSLMERLAALQQSVGSLKQAADNESVAPVDETVPESTDNEQGAHPLHALGFEQQEVSGQRYWCRVLRYDLLTRHGDVRFQEIASAALDGLYKAIRIAPVSVEQLRFYDTESTGLGTGAGTIPFLHSVGQVEGDEFALYQYFLNDYGEEPAILDALFRRHFTQDVTVVSFNGKSFDWPLLTSRVNMHRKRAVQLPHLDLLYPCRRLWRGKLPRVSLSHVEAGVLGLRRADDLPGKEAPARYFSYMEDMDARKIDPVLEHNATDVCSLVALTTVLGYVLSGKRAVDTAQEYLALGKYYDEWQDYDLAERCFLAASGCPDATWKAHWLQSLHLKRRRRFADASAVWVQMAERYTWSVQPVVELAKFYEHVEKDYDAAEDWAREAVKRTKQERFRHAADGRFTEDYDGVLHALEHRLSRIARKKNTVANRR